MKKRAIAELVTGRKAVDGAGVHLVRVLGSPTVRTFDPFLMLDAFDSHNPDDYIKGFPTHPHRGIETFTYLMRGRIDHEDSLGNAGSIVDGGCQWMTAGSGILHQEMPLPSRQLLGLQLWINLPHDRKMVDPEYRDIKADMVPAVEEGGARVAIVAGEYKGMAGATRGDHVDVTFLDISLKPGALWSMETRPQETVFAYMVEGECELSGDGGVIPHRNACLFTLGDSLSLVGGAEGARFVLVSGTPLREPVAWGGPIVMNTDEDLKQAFFELEDGTFIRHAPRGKAG